VLAHLITHLLEGGVLTQQNYGHAPVWFL